MVTASQLQNNSASQYKYAMAGSDYKALANENNTQQQQGKALTSEEAYRQRKGLSTERASSAQPAQAAVAQAQPATTQNAPVAQVTQAAAPVNKTSGLPQGETFQYTLSHAQQNKFVRENQSKVAAGQPALTELQFRKNIGMDTSTVGGAYTAPKVTNNSVAPGTAATSTKDVGSTNKAATGSGDQKIAAQKAASSANSNASAVSGTPQQAQASVISALDTQKQKEAAAAKKAADAAQAAAAATKAADAKRAAVQEAAAIEKAAAAARAEAKKIADASAKAAATKRANALQKQADAAKKAAKAAEDDADAKAKLANVYGEASYYAEIAAKTGNAAAARKAAVAVKSIKSVKAEVQKTSARAKALGVTSREGQILLKDGTYINQVERKGNGGKGERGVTISKESAKTIAAKKKAKAQKDAAEAAQAEKNYQKIIGNQGQILDAIEGKGQKGTGEGAVVYLSTNKKTGTTYAKSGKQYTDEQSERKRLTNKSLTVITPEMTAKQIEKALTKNATIQAARDETADRTASAFGRSAVLSIDPKTGSMRMKAATGKANDMGAFKTVDQARTEKLLKSDSALVRASIAANQKFLEMGSYKNVTATISREKQRLDSKYAGKLPSLSKIETSRNAAFTKVGLEEERLAGQKAIYGNKYGKAAMDLGTSSYDSLNMHPVSAAATVAGIYASGVIGGVLIEGALGAGAAGAGAVALKASSGAVKTGATLASKYLPSAGRGVLGLSVLYEGGKTVATGDAAKTVNFIAGLAIGGIGYAKGAKIVKDPISIIPGVKTIHLQEVTPGHGTGVKDIRVGESLAIGSRTLVSRNIEGKLIKGAPSLPYEITKGKIVQSFNKKDTAAFLKTVEKQAGRTDADIFRYGKSIADVAYRQSKPVTTPKSFAITSEHVSTQMKPVVKDTILSYNKLKTQNIEVYGSVAQKAQMEGFLSRKPQDIEVSVSNVTKFVQLFKVKATKAGFVEGKDFRVTTKEADAPKIEFKIDGKWEKGVEVFSEKSGVPSEELAGYRPEAGIAFGYKKLKSIKVESAKLMKLQEQAARKHAGATTLQDGSLKPVHPGRVKDIKDLIEIGVANEVTFKTGIASDIINYARLTAQKDAKVLESPVVKHIVEKEKLPTHSEMKVLSSSKLQKSESDLIIHRQLSAHKRTLAALKALDKETPVRKTGSKSTGSTKGKANVKPRFRGSKVSEKADKELLFESKKISSRAVRVPRTISRGISNTGRAASRAVSSKTAKTSSRVRTVKTTSIATPAISKRSSRSVSADKKQVPASYSSDVVSKKRPYIVLLPKATTSKTSHSATPSKAAPSKVTPSKAAPSKKPSSTTASKRTPSKQAPMKVIPSKPTTKSTKQSTAVPKKSNGAGSDSKSSSQGYSYRTDTPNTIRRKKQNEDKAVIKTQKDIMLLTRKLKNTLGSLDSMFNTPMKTTTKRSTKRVSRA